MNEPSKYMNDLKLRTFLGFLEARGYVIVDTSSRCSADDEEIIEEFNKFKWEDN